MEPLTDAQEAAAILCCGKDRREIVAIVAGQVATIAADRKRIEAAEELIATMERYPGDAHGADEWYCERMEKDIAAYRDAYPAKKGE